MRWARTQREDWVGPCEGLAALSSPGVKQINDCCTEAKQKQAPVRIQLHTAPSYMGGAALAAAAAASFFPSFIPSSSPAFLCSSLQKNKKKHI